MATGEHHAIAPEQMHYLGSSPIILNITPPYKGPQAHSDTSAVLRPVMFMITHPMTFTRYMDLTLYLGQSLYEQLLSGRQYSIAMV